MFLIGLLLKSKSDVSVLHLKYGFGCFVLL